MVLIRNDIALIIENDLTIDDGLDDRLGLCGDFLRNVRMELGESLSAFSKADNVVGPLDGAVLDGVDGINQDVVHPLLVAGQN